MNEPTDMHGPSTTARVQTERYARCQLCGAQWQIKSSLNEDAKCCSFCGCEKVSVLSERADYGGAVKYGL